MDNQKKIWALIPARGGSKSIPKKNIADLGGKPLIEYGIRAATLSNQFEKIVCSTDDPEIAAIATALGAEIDIRPEILATDEASVADVARDFLSRQEKPPHIIGLIQPTSPFVLPEHISSVINKMILSSDSMSGQTVSLVNHNSHAWNQRIYDNGKVYFKYKRERESAFNKQRKPKLFTFGNFVAARCEALIGGMDFFAEPSIAVEIKWPYNLDVDDSKDLDLARLLIHSNFFINH